MIYEFDGYKPVINPSSYVHKEATIIGNVIIGKDVYIGPGASLRGDWGQIIIKDGCNIQDNCIIHIFPGQAVEEEGTFDNMRTRGLDEFKNYLGKSKKPFMATFYKEVRRKSGILMGADGNPIGGKWSLDEDNRNDLCLPKN